MKKIRYLEASALVWCNVLLLSAPELLLATLTLLDDRLSSTGLRPSSLFRAAASAFAFCFSFSESAVITLRSNRRFSFSEWWTFARSCNSSRESLVT
jgi:hypothetical protein